MLLTRDIRWKKIASIVFASVFLALVLFPLCVASEPSLSLDKVQHDIQPDAGKATLSAEVVRDDIHISGITTADSRISVRKIAFGEKTEIDVPVSPSGSFSTSVQLEIGPGFTQAVERGDVKVTVVATQGKATKELAVPLGQETSGAISPNLIGASLNGATPGYPHTLVVYNNPWLFYTGQYVDDSGNSVQATKDAVATQLAKFSAVSLHYTDDASNIALIKQKNPSTKVFAYVNPVFCYKSTDPNSEWQRVVKNHPEWFLYPDAASRQSKTNPIVMYNGTEQVMDLTTAWRAEIVSVSKGALTKGFDGLYIDCVCDDPSLCYGSGATTGPAGNWHAALNAYLDQVRVSGKQNFYNGQSPVVVSTNQDFLSRTDGWMDEGFISYKGWKLSAIDMPQHASAQNKFSMFYAVNPSVAARHFYFASALLSDGYFFYAPTSTQWFAEYGTYIGNPAGQAYQIQGFSGVWARNYTAAKVIVNPTSEAVTVSRPGSVDSSGKPVSQITINPYDGVILPSLSLSVSNPSPAVGQSYTLSGLLRDSAGRPVANKPIDIWYRHAGETTGHLWKTVYTGTDGKYSTTAASSQTVYLRAVFMGDSAHARSYSNFVTVTPGRTTLTLTASTTTPLSGQSYTLSGSLSDGNGKALANKPIDIWVRHDGDNGKLWKTMTTDSNGKYSTTASSTKKAYIRTVFKGDSAYATSRSNFVTISVTLACV